MEQRFGSTPTIVVSSNVYYERAHVKYSDELGVEFNVAFGLGFRGLFENGGRLLVFFGLV